MKSKRILVIFAALSVAIGINSCKKDNQSPIQSLFTGGKWVVASVLAFNYIGNTQVSIDTLNTACDSSQYFIFNANNTCTFTNFDCIKQVSQPAKWSLSPNQLFLQTEVVCQDTVAADNSKPFAYASIQNLGQFSLVLQTGDIEPNYSLTKPRRIIQYGFVRQQLNGTD
jgi:hypothetical protein